MRQTKKETRLYLKAAEDVARGAGGILKRGFTRSPDIRLKGRIDPVTAYDLKSEKFIVRSLLKRFPDHAVLAEEGSGSDREGQYRWIIDPLDGTVDYAHGFPVYCVSIALECDGQIIVGVVFDPERQEMFSAGLGLGAHMNGRRIKVSAQSNLERALLATGFSYNIKHARKNNLGLFARMAKRAQGIRRLGSAAIDLCWLAAGRIDGFWELYLHPWDTAAGKLIVQEAGGIVTRFDGREYSIVHKDILASNGRIHRAMQEVL
jgi:myo-inositol-1(or 4)-monophosphatase